MMPHLGCAVMYHYIRNPERNMFEDLKALRPEQFEEQIDWLANHYQIINHDLFFDLILQKKNFQSKKPFMLLTFDDGFLEHYEIVFPILKKRKLSGIFFVAGNVSTNSKQVLNIHKIHFLIARIGREKFCHAVVEKFSSDFKCELEGSNRDPVVYRYDEQSGYHIKNLLNYALPINLVDSFLSEMFRTHIGPEEDFFKTLYLSHEMITEMAECGMTFGYHSSKHRVLSRLNAQEQGIELASGVRELKQLTNQSEVPFCYPYGHRRTYNGVTLRLLNEIGYSTAFNTVREFISANSLNNRYEIPRFDTNDLPPFKEMANA